MLAGWAVERAKIRSLDGPPGAWVAQRAAEQHGVVDAQDLRELGLDGRAAARRVRAGWLHPLYPGVYVVGHPALSLRGRYLAAVKACGRAAALSHRSAADLWAYDRALPG